MATILVSSYGNGSASQGNFLAAYSASSAGDIIVFPLSGSSTWSSSIAINRPLTIDGNGTTLTAGIPIPGFFTITNMTSSVLMRITGFDFELVNFTATGRALYATNVSLSALRIDHNIFRYGYETMEIGGCKGVIDHNTFYNPLKAISFTAGTVAQANESWSSLTAGTGEALFIESNNFIYDANYPGAYHQETIGTFNGGKLVVRYNTWNSDNEPDGLDTVVPLLTHGSAAGGNPTGYWQTNYQQGNQCRRGQSVVEMYGNVAHGKQINFLAQLRGSANLIHDNVLDTTLYNPRIIAYEEEQYEGSNWNPLRTAWPAEDQVHNSFFWNNTLRLNGATNTNYFEVSSGSEAYIQQDRDYFLHAPAATGGYEYFTGLNGASNTYPTNGVVYSTYGTMVFNPSGSNAYYGYTPYTFPHPLALDFATRQYPGRANVGVDVFEFI